MIFINYYLPKANSIYNYSILVVTVVLWQ